MSFQYGLIAADFVQPSHGGPITTGVDPHLHLRPKADGPHAPAIAGTKGKMKTKAKDKRPNKLFRACVQCVTAKTRCEDVLPPGCSVCRRKGKACSLAGAVGGDAVDGYDGMGAGTDCGDDDREEFEVDGRNGNGYGSRRPTSVSAGPGISYPPLHPIRPRSALGAQSYPAAHVNGIEEGAVMDWQDRIAESEARIRQLEDRVATLQSIALSQPATALSYPTHASDGRLLGQGQGSGLPQSHAAPTYMPSHPASSAVISPYDSPSTASHLHASSGPPVLAITRGGGGDGIGARDAPTPGLTASTSGIEAISHSHRPHPRHAALVANKHSRYTYSFNGGWIVSAYTPPAALCLASTGCVSADEVEVAWCAFQQAPTIATRLPLGIWSAYPGTAGGSAVAGGSGCGFGDLASRPKDHPYLVIAMMHHVSPFNRRTMHANADGGGGAGSGATGAPTSLTQAADQVVLASLKPLGRASGDSTIEVVASLLVLALAPTLPDVAAPEYHQPLSDADARQSDEVRASSRLTQAASATQTIPRPSPARYAALALQLGRDAGLQAEVDNILRVAAHQLGEGEWREAYLKVELWLAVVNTYNLLQTMQTHRAPLAESLLDHIPASARALNPALYASLDARAELVRLAHAALVIMDRIEDEQPAAGGEVTRGLMDEWKRTFEELISYGGASGVVHASITLDRDCLCQALIVRFAMLIQHLPAPLGPLRWSLMPQMGHVRPCADSMFRHVVPDDQLRSIKQALASTPSRHTGSGHIIGHTEGTGAGGPVVLHRDGEDTQHVDTDSAYLLHASPLLRAPAYVAQATLLGYMTMQGTVAYMRNMAALARQRQLALQQQKADANANANGNGNANVNGVAGGEKDPEESPQETKSGNTSAKPSAAGIGSASDIEAELASVMDMVRFDAVARRLRAANGVYGVILDSLDAMHGNNLAAAASSTSASTAATASVPDKKGTGSAATGAVRANHAEHSAGSGAREKDGNVDFGSHQGSHPPMNTRQPYGSAAVDLGAGMMGNEPAPPSFVGMGMGDGMGMDPNVNTGMEWNTEMGTGMGMGMGMGMGFGFGLGMPPGTGMFDTDLFGGWDLWNMGVGMGLDAGLGPAPGTGTALGEASGNGTGTEWADPIFSASDMMANGNGHGHEHG